MHIPAILGAIYFFSEIGLALSRRARAAPSANHDQGTLRVLWIVIFLSIMLGLYCASHFPAADLGHRRLWVTAGVVLFTLALMLRWWAIIVLGRFFTVDITIAKDHKLIEAGPFRYIRHPSYTGVILAFLGFALTFANAAVIVAIVVPIFCALVYRMNVEERALTAALGEPYRAYMRRTSRLAPFVY